MKARLLALTIGAISIIMAVIVFRTPDPPAVNLPPLPTEKNAKQILNSTHRHREWVAGAFIVYPERSDKAPIALLSDNGPGASDWIRAVADQAAAQGYIAVVPDSASQSDREAARRYALSLPAANGRSARLQFDPGSGGVRVDGNQPLPWPQALAFVNRRTGNHPVSGTNPNVPEDHSAHIAMAMAQAPPGGRGYPMAKPPNLPAGIFTAKNALANSKLRKEFVDIPVGSVQLHTWIEYPDGSDKAPVVIVMQHGPGLDDWQRALADQLALQGFIAIAPDLFSALGPNGGNYDSFSGPDDVLRTNARLTQDEGIRRYKAAWEYGMKLPRANGKSATVGFCAGGGYSFRFAGEVPDINAAVVYYGTPPDEAIMTRIKAPVLAFYGDDDARVTATLDPASANMKKLGKSFESHTYPHGTHGFLEYQDVGGNPAATSDSWARTIAFLNQHTK